MFDTPAPVLGSSECVLLALKRNRYMTILRHRKPALALALLACASQAALGSTNNFVVPQFRGSADTTVGYWEEFTVAYGAPGNRPSAAGYTTDAVLTQVGSPTAFLTGTHNIYDNAAATSFTLAETTPFNIGSVVLQARTVAFEIDYNAVSLAYLDGTGSHSVQPSFRLELDRSSGVSSLWEWDLRGLGVKDYTVSFKAADPSMSFDSMTLDTFKGFETVPEPAPLALLGLGLAWLARRKFVANQRKAASSGVAQ